METGSILRDGDIVYSIWKHIAVSRDGENLTNPPEYKDHDECQFEVTGTDQAHTIQLAEELMAATESLATVVGNRLGCPIPIEAAASMGLDWSQTH